MAAGAGVGWVVLADDGSDDAAESQVVSGEPTFVALRDRPRLVDTSVGGSTIDGRHAASGSVDVGETRRFLVAGRGGPDADSTVVLDVRAVSPTDGDVTGSIDVHACDTGRHAATPLVLDGKSDAALVATRLSADGEVCVDSEVRADLTIDLVAIMGGTSFRSVRGATIFDDVPLEPAKPLIVNAVGAVGAAAPEASAGTDDALWLAADVRSDSDGQLVVGPCEPGTVDVVSMTFRAGVRSAETVLAAPAADGSLCVTSSAGATVTIDVIGVVDSGGLAFASDPQRILDTAAGGTTVDDLWAGTGRRPAASTFRVDVAGRGDVPADATAVIISTAVHDPLGTGSAVVHSPGSVAPPNPRFEVHEAITSASTAMVALGPRGDLCVHTDVAAHVTLDVIAWTTADDAGAEASAETSTGGAETDGAQAAVDAECPHQELFPYWRIVAIYGTERTGRLGLLGEQPAEESYPRLAELVDQWAALDDRPILPAYDLITTLATATSGAEGLYNLPAEDEFVQRYLDAAREHGVYLILDIQPGRSDFLTEAKRYEKFLREPDVGLALDPEWRTAAPNKPGGGYVGQVSVGEVNEVAAWLSDIVAEERLPEKLLVVHQFQDRMITGKEFLEDPPGIAMMIHMDGQGGRNVKLDTYSRTTVAEPLHNGFKLFFDEDIDMFSPSDILGPTVEPTPDLISYQ